MEMEEVAKGYERKSDVDGYTIIWRNHGIPKVHLLRSWGECNVELARKRGVKVTGVVGSREVLNSALEGRRAEDCRRCFPRPEMLEEPVLVEEYADMEEG